jgi:hypothetical protein
MTGGGSAQGGAGARYGAAWRGAAWLRLTAVRTAWINGHE